MKRMAQRILPGTARGPVLSLTEGLSFWGGVDPASARIIDAHHPQHGADIAGKVLMMPTSRGSCSGSGVMLELLLNDCAPAALIFSVPEDVATLGVLIGEQMFDRSLPVLRVRESDFARLSRCPDLKIDDTAIHGDGFILPIYEQDSGGLALSPEDQHMLDGGAGEAAALAMRIICTMARLQGAARLTDVAHGHIDGCILANQANLIFAETMDRLGATIRIPTTINAISVDRRNWQRQGVPPDFGNQASRLADAYVRMGCRPTFTCAPYLLKDRPALAQDIAWAESNAVIYANSVLGARTPKHPDYLDLCIAMTGRAPLAGVYLQDERRPARILDFKLPADADDAVWPLIGYLAGLHSPDRIPLLRGLAGLHPTTDDLKALCAAFGTTSAAPMLHVEDVTPEATLAPRENADCVNLGPADLASAHKALNDGPCAVELIAIGSPHASATECRELARLLGGQKIVVPTIVTAGREIISALEADGTLSSLGQAGVQVIPDLCWCSITEPILPPDARTVMTNSGKYAHYGPGLSGRAMRFGSLRDCAQTALGGHAPDGLPHWLKSATA